jgi:hypothetical protein
VCFSYAKNQRKQGKAMETEKKTPEEAKKLAPAAEQKDEP